MSDDQPPNERNALVMIAHKDCRCDPSYRGPWCEPCQIRYHIRRHAEKDAEIAELREENESLQISKADITRSADKWYERYREQELALATDDARIAELEAELQGWRDSDIAQHEGNDQALAAKDTEIASLKARIADLLGDADFDGTAEDYPSDPPVTRKELLEVLLSMHSMSHNTLVSGYERQVIGPVNIDMLKRLERGEDARGEG